MVHRPHPGDPTEPDIVSTASGACWLDFEYAGRNTIAGEIAHLLWYLLALGGWLVPLHQRDAYVRTLRRHLPPLRSPSSNTPNSPPATATATLTSPTSGPPVPAAAVRPDGSWRPCA
ncbi:hypothetical protein AB0940_29765 [Streptomyces sp. NPDC006656]|uniref:hypothetical protein n=1 Tax=Streptomyces sp. NPDC006656 TaxID=3156899 RepID=UPI00345327A1